MSQSRSKSTHSKAQADLARLKALKAALALESNMTESEAVLRIRRSEALLKEMDVAERSGKLLPVEQVTSAQFNIDRQRRDAMLNLGERISAMLASEMKNAVIAAGVSPEQADALDAGRVHEILMTEIRKGLEEYADSLVN